MNHPREHWSTLGDIVGSIGKNSVLNKIKHQNGIINDSIEVTHCADQFFAIM